MRTEPAEYDQINRYLLGTLPEAEVAQVEVRLLEDADYLDLVRAAEDDLIDAYLGQELSKSDKQRFERVFAALPHRQEQVSFARQLSALLNENAATPTSESAAQRWRSLLQGLNWRWQYASAALVLTLVVLSMWLYFNLRQTRYDLAQSQAETERSDRQREELLQQNNASGSRTDELSKELAAERNARQQQEQIAQQLQRERDLQRQRARSDSGSPSIATFVLSPGFTRGTDEPTRFVVQPAIKLMRLQLDLEAGDEYKSYRAELRTTGGNVVWSREGLRAQSIGGGRSVIISLPVVQLNSGEYELTLRARNASRSLEDIGYYYFSVLKR